MAPEPRRLLRRSVSLLLAVVLVVAVVGLVYIVLAPLPMSEPYTEFYILGPGGQATDYPDELTVGETGELIVGITNREHEARTYTITLVLNGERIRTEIVDVADGETWEGRFTFTPTEPGEQTLNIQLYLGPTPIADDDPYRTVQLQLTVTASGSG